MKAYREDMRQQGLGNVYFVRIVDGEKRREDGELAFLCKVGSTQRSVYDRIREFVVVRPEEDVALVAVATREDYKELEKRLHLRFARHKQKGEWFWLTMGDIVTAGEEEGGVRFIE